MRSLSAACLRDLPAPDAAWHVILGYLDRYVTVIDGYAYGDRHGGYQQFLQRAERQFRQTGDVGTDLHGILALIYLVYRRHRHSEAEFVDIDVHRPFVQALLRQARALRGAHQGRFYRKTF
jgi:hypothetical protein